MRKARVSPSAPVRLWEECLNDGMRSMTVTLAGDLDLSLRDRVATALPEPKGLGRLVIDCAAVTSIESVVIAVFMRYRRRWMAEGNDPLNIVFLAPDALRRTFEIAGMSEWFTMIRVESNAASTHRK